MNPYALPDQAPPIAIPVLTALVASADIPAGLRLELERQQAEKTAFFALADALTQSLRPEVDRLVSEVVQRSLQASWAQRHSVTVVREAGDPSGAVDLG